MSNTKSNTSRQSLLINYSRKTHFVLALLLIAVLAILVVSSASVYALLNRRHMRNVLTTNARIGISATCHASLEMLDPELIDDIDSDTDLSELFSYQRMMNNLNDLCINVEAQRIYLVKPIDGTFYCLWDTSSDNRHDLLPMTLDALQSTGFDGVIAFELAEPGTTTVHINRGVAPLYYHGEVIAIVGVEFSNGYVNEAYSTTTWFMWLMISGLVVTMSALFVITLLLFRQDYRYQQQLFDLANRDSVTNLPNRRYLFNYLKDYLGEPESPHADRSMAAFFIDLDHFKSVNDSSGHEAGDVLLRQVADFLSDTIIKSVGARGHAVLTARLGGDEFVQLITDADVLFATEYANSLEQQFTECLQMTDYIQGFQGNISIGVAVFPQHTTHYNDLVKYADIAMYHSKNDSPNKVTVYDPSMGDHIEGVTLSVRNIR